MLEFKVEDMTCGHCVANITKAVAGVAPDAILEADLPNHVVRIRGAQLAESGAVDAAIREAGYTPQLLS